MSYCVIKDGDKNTLRCLMDKICREQDEKIDITKNGDEYSVIFQDSKFYLIITDAKRMHRDYMEGPFFLEIDEKRTEMKDDSSGHKKMKANQEFARYITEIIKQLKNL